MSRRTGGKRKPLVGLVVEGQTEYAAIPIMLANMGVRCTRSSNFHGQAVEVSAETLVEKSLLPHVLVQLSREVDQVIVILDREQRESSAVAFGREILKELRVALGSEHAEKVAVVVCDRTFENWLIADPPGILRSRLVKRDLTRKVNCHADTKNAISLLGSAFGKGTSFHKARHGQELAKHLRVGDSKVDLCSKSLRQFVALIQKTAEV